MAFYLRAGTAQQLAAAENLKICGWRFHTRLGRWFQRASEPVVMTDHFEEGAVYWFDPNTCRVCTEPRFLFE